MPLEGPNKQTRRDFLKGASLAGALGGAGAAGMYSGLERKMEEINSRILTPRIIESLKEAHISDADIHRLEIRINSVIRSEIERSKLQ